METSDFVSDPGYASELSNSLYQLQQSGHLIDTFIKTKTGGINAHKIVLFANGGPYLQEQISRTVSLDTTMCNIDLSHILHEDVLAVITYLYTGKLKLSCIESESCIKLFQFLEIDLEKLKDNTTTAATEKVVNIESESEDKDKSGDKMDSKEPKNSSEKSDSGDSENEPFEIEISNIQEEGVKERSDFVGQVQIFHETTGELVKLGDAKIKPLAVRDKKKRLASAKKRKKEPEPLAEKRKRKAVPEETKKEQVESANKRKSPRTRKKEIEQPVEEQQNETLESSASSSSEINKVFLEEGTICSECSLDVRECVCEFPTCMDSMTCMRCHIRYTTKEDFIKHREEKHSLRCGMCDFKITRGSNLVSHMLEKHGISSNQLETGKTVKQEKTTEKQKDNEENPVSTETNNSPVPMKTTTPNEKKINTAKYRQWSPADMLNAIKIIREQNISVRKAAKLYNVPLTTLRDRVDGRHSVETLKSGPEPLLSQEEEAKLVNYISYMSTIGYGFSRTQVLEFATDLAVSSGKRDRNQPLSMYWFYEFLGRWPELPVVKPRPSAAVREQSVTQDIIDKYFEELKSTLDKYNFLDKPQSIYNLDKKEISTHHHPPNIVANHGVCSQSITSPREANMTIIGCGNALGQMIPPYYIFAGKRMRKELLNDCLPGTAGTVTDNGLSNSFVFEVYLCDHFQQHVHASPDNPVLILFDGHTSHITISVIEWAKDMGVILFMLPPHNSHIQQILDMGCLGPLESIYNKECSSFLINHPGRTISKINVCQVLSKAYSHALSSENLRSAFRRLGIYPFDPLAFSISNIAPSSIIEVDTDKSTSTDSVVNTQ